MEIAMTQNAKAGGETAGSEPFVVLLSEQAALVHGGSGKNDPPPPPPETREGGPKVGPGIEFRD
jgi:hypothetical protein